MSERPCASVEWVSGGNMPKERKRLRMSGEKRVATGIKRRVND